MKNQKVSIVGLGYVGIPLLEELAKKGHIIFGIDNSKEKVQFLIKKFIKFKNKFLFSNNFKSIGNSDFVIVCVPTPINDKNKPNLTQLRKACKFIGKNLKKKTTIIFESTVYPGVTEEICVPIIEKYSKLTWLTDFNIGYSPERISPGEKNKTLTKITKIISGDTKKTLNKLKKFYKSIIRAGVYEADSIKVAEAAKILENIQRDTNIALMNEISIIFNKLNINTLDVIKAASTKWNFNTYLPGLVGGHCIGVDPYYLVYKSKKEGHIPDIINAARKVNNFMPDYVTNEILKNFKRKNFSKKKILILGITFKENCGDIRNSRSFDIYRNLSQKKIDCYVYDPIAKSKEVKEEYNIKLFDIKNLNFKIDGIIVTVSHKKFDKKLIVKLLKNICSGGFIFDVKSKFKNKYYFRKDLKIFNL